MGHAGHPAREGNVELLATMLVARHVRISVPDGTVRDLLAEELPETSYRADLVEREMHCIAVVGAGASAPLLERGRDLATKLEKQFTRDEAELDRLKLVNNLKRKAFETRLIALSRTPAAARQVRDTISEKYHIQHPTLLGYELLAHLLKHRYLDAIISLNFDELLDQSLDDEMDEREYKQVVSERDCRNLQADPSANDYVPLYVKLHGTASEPDSLRFTPDSYYSIPQRIARVVEELLHTEHCVVANIGSGLASFDLQRFLRIPQQLDVFNLSRKPVHWRVGDKIARERGASKAERRDAQKREAGDRYPWLHECNAWEAGCDELLKELSATIERVADTSGLPTGTAPGSFGRLVQFRSVRRHEAVAQLLGPNALHSEWAKTEGWAERDLLDYAWRRAILELAFAGAKGRGLLSLVPLVEDRPARYYELFGRRSKRGVGAEDWAELCSAAGLEESDEVPDILLSQVNLRAELRGEAEASSGSVSRPDIQCLHPFDPVRLAHHVLLRVKNGYDDSDLNLLAETFNGLQDESEFEQHMQDDRVCSKAFRCPSTLPTATSLQAYTWLILKDLRPDDHVDISSETGDWLLREPVLSMLSEQTSIRLLLAFDIEAEKLYEEYGDRLDCRMIDPWRHNRHMTIACDGNRPKIATYFARRQRTSVITAVFLEGMRDVTRLADVYRQRWDEAMPLKRIVPGEQTLPAP
jgi:hypothetical protein